MRCLRSSWSFVYVTGQERVKRELADLAASKQSPIRSQNIKVEYQGATPSREPTVSHPKSNKESFIHQASPTSIDYTRSYSIKEYDGRPPPVENKKLFTYTEPSRHPPPALNKKAMVRCVTSLAASTSVPKVEDCTSSYPGSHRRCSYDNHMIQSGEINKEWRQNWETLDVSKNASFQHFPTSTCLHDMKYENDQQHSIYYQNNTSFSNHDTKELYLPQNQAQDLTKKSESILNMPIKHRQRQDLNTVAGNYAKPIDMNASYPGQNTGNRSDVSVDYLPQERSGGESSGKDSTMMAESMNQSRSQTLTHENMMMQMFAAGGQSNMPDISMMLENMDMASIASLMSGFDFDQIISHFLNLPTDTEDEVSDGEESRLNATPPPRPPIWQDLMSSFFQQFQMKGMSSQGSSAIGRTMINQNQQKPQPGQNLFNQVHSISPQNQAMPIASQGQNRPVQGASDSSVGSNIACQTPQQCSVPKTVPGESQVSDSGGIKTKLRPFNDRASYRPTPLQKNNQRFSKHAPAATTTLFDSDFKIKYLSSFYHHPSRVRRKLFQPLVRA